MLAGIQPRLGTAGSQAGDIIINATGGFRLTGQGVFNVVQGESNAGNIIIDVGTLTVTNGAELTSSTFGQGDAGNVAIIVRDTATFDGVGRNGRSSGARSQVQPNAVGKGGTLTLNVGTLNVTNGAQLNSSTLGQGDAGNVAITVRDAATFDGVDSNGNSSSAATQVAPSAVGKGGMLTLNVGTLNVTNGAQLNSSTFGQGDAGNVAITVRDAANFDGVGSNGSPSAARSKVEPDAVGKGGTLTLTAGTLNVTNGAELTSSTSGQRDAAGNIVLRVRDTIQVTNGSISTFSLFTNGGSIDIAAKAIRLSGNSDILTNVVIDAGVGGNITLSANSIIALGDSDILAFAQDGRGGNITLNTRAFFGQNYRPGSLPPWDNNDRVDINASGTISGTISIPDVSFIQNGLNQLPKSAIDTEKLVSQTCIVRKDKPQGTFYILGKTNLPQRPGDLIPSNYSTQEPIIQTANKPWQKGDPIVEPTGFYKLANGRLVMSRECDR